jgi:hypothetical protein
MDWVELLLEPRHHGASLDASKTISEPMVCLTQTVRLSCTDTNMSPNGPNEVPHDPCHLDIPSRASRMISEPVERSTQIVHLYCVKISTIPKRNETSIHLGLVTLEYHWVRPKQFLSLWYVSHKPCTYLVDTNTVSKRTKMRFHMAHITKEFHRVRPKWFLSLWYVRRKPCTYLASRFTLSPNGLNRASSWASLPWSTIGCIQNDFWAYDTFGTNSAPIFQ